MNEILHCFIVLSHILCFWRNTKLHFPFSPQLQAENSIFHVNDSDFRITLGIKYENFSTSWPPGPGSLSAALHIHHLFCRLQLASRLMCCEEVGFFILQVTLFGPRPSCDTQQRLVIVLKICEEVKSRDQVNESWAAQGKWQITRFSGFRKIDWNER